MTERKEKTMLKWLKQKPTHGHGALPIEKITDDPLATIQVHPHAKKSKNKANEIYAVSRVNPLFEEDGKEVFSPGGNSGSSGYDSGSGPSDDDFPIIHNVATELKDLQTNLLGRLATTPTTVGATTTTEKHQHIFINTENDVIHHETAIVGPNGRPILQILEQNPNYVKSIALSVANNGRKRPLSPISESSQQQNNVQALQLQLSQPQHDTQNPTNISAIRSPPTLSKYNLSTSGSLYNKDAKYTFSSNANKNSNYSTVDSIGSAKLIKKDSQYVRSIRIGGPTNFVNTTGTKRSILEANRRFSSSSSNSSHGGTPSRRPSVTFADDVGTTTGSRSGSRKPSMEQDSIVTESLLMMTSVGGNRFSTPSNHSSTSNSRKTSVSSSQSRSQDESGAGTESEIVSSGQDIMDLEAFANSLKKSRPIKQLSSSASSSSGKNRTHGSRDDLDEISSSSSNPGEGYDLAEASPPEERRISTLDRPTSSAVATSPTPRIHGKKSHKSPFGGIADHYAAAKEIAKEIESYSNGSAKASTKKSLVRDLLYRSNRNASSSVSTNDNINATKVVSNSSGSRDTGYGAYNGNNGFRTSRVGGVSSNNGREGNIAQDPPRQISSNNSRLPTLQQEQPVVLAARASSPIYFQSPFGASSAKGGSSSSNRRGTGTGASNAVYSSSPQDVLTTLNSGGSSDWELVRVQQVYVKAGSSSQDQQSQQLTQKKQKKNGKEGDSSTMSNASGGGGGDSSSSRDSRAVVHQGQDHASTITISTSSGTTNSRRHPSSSHAVYSSKSTSSAVTKGKAAKKVPSADDGLATGARSRVENDETDSGNSSERAYTEVRLEIEGTKIELSGENVSDTTIQVEDDSTRPENLPSKVMIVTGDSQNIVVDLTGVPLDLKNAIVSGTALITLPDGLDKMLQPGYTMITIPATNTAKTTSPVHSQLVVDGGGSTLGSSPAGPLRNSSKDGVMNITIGLDDDKPLVTSGGSSGNNSDDECKLFATKNKAQIWDVMQQTVGKQHDGGGGGKTKKKITTIFPFHPNQDTYESPDFTIEGHRLDRQRKKVEHEKRRRCACRLCGILFFLLAFLGVLVALSMIYTKGQRYFGSV